MFILTNYLLYSFIKNDINIENKSFDNYLNKETDIRETYEVISQSFAQNFDKNTAQELYLTIRVKQINFIIFTFIYASAYSLFYIILKYYILYDQFDITTFKSTPSTHFAVVLYFLYGLSSLTPSIIYYFCFYFIIRNDYKAKTKKKVKRSYNEMLTGSTPIASTDLFLTDELVDKVKKDRINNNDDIRDFIKN